MSLRILFLRTGCAGIATLGPKGAEAHQWLVLKPILITLMNKNMSLKSISKITYTFCSGQARPLWTCYTSNLGWAGRRWSQ
jgi:hypothetical protein